MTYGFIGLGNMGRGMASRLVSAGFDVLVNDTNPVAVAALTDAGARQAGSAQALASEAEIVFVSLPTPDVVETVVLGPNGIAQGRVRIIVDLSTTGREAARRMGASLAERGIALIDAPVSGGTTGAATGTLAIMAAGKLEAFKEVEAALSQIGNKIFYMGDEPGQGQMMKLVNNMMLASATVTAFEALVLGAKAGIDSAKMLEVVNASSGRSFATEVKIAQCVLDRSFPMRFATALLAKDVRLCIEEGDRQEVPMPVSKRVQEFLGESMAQGFADEDYGTIIKVIEARAGAQFGIEKEHTDE